MSNTGTWMQRVAQDWLVLTELTDHSAVAVGITTGLQFGPMLLLGPFAGVLLDRWSRQRVLVLANLARVLLVVGVAALIWTGVGGTPLYAAALVVISVFPNASLRQAAAAYAAVLVVVWVARYLRKRSGDT